MPGRKRRINGTPLSLGPKATAFFFFTESELKARQCSLHLGQNFLAQYLFIGPLFGLLGIPHSQRCALMELTFQWEEEDSKENTDASIDGLSDAGMCYE